MRIPEVEREIRDGEWSAWDEECLAHMDAGQQAAEDDPRRKLKIKIHAWHPGWLTPDTLGWDEAEELPFEDDVCPTCGGSGDAPEPEKEGEK